MPRKLLTVNEIVALTGHKPATVRSWIVRGVLPVTRIGKSRAILVSDRDLARFLAKPKGKNLGALSAEVDRG